MHLSASVTISGHGSLPFCKQVKVTLLHHISCLGRPSGCFHLDCCWCHTLNRGPFCWIMREAALIPRPPIIRNMFRKSLAFITGRKKLSDGINVFRICYRKKVDRFVFLQICRRSAKSFQKFIVNVIASRLFLTWE